MGAVCPTVPCTISAGTVPDGETNVVVVRFVLFGDDTYDAFSSAAQA